MHTRGIRLLLVATLGLSVLLAGGFAQTPGFTFDEDTPGMPPRGFSFAATRQDAPGTWEVRGQALPPHHLVHVADWQAAKGFSLAIVSEPAPANIKLIARIRLVDGERVGGLVWRYRDANNYYALGIDLLEHDVALYRIMGGNRIRLDHSTEFEIDPAIWHTAGIVHVGDQIRVHLDGIGLLQARDRTFTAGGRAGVWSGGAATTWFDDIRIEEFTEPLR